MRMNNIVQDIKKLQDSLEKLYNTSSINYNGNIGQQQQQQQSSSTTSAHQQLLKDDIRILLDVLECPVFESIVNVQVDIFTDKKPLIKNSYQTFFNSKYSLQQLREQFINHPSLLPVDFDIDQTTLELKLNPNIPNDDNNNNNLSININQQQQLNKHHPPTSTSTTLKIKIMIKLEQQQQQQRQQQ
ncbi:hypothetical protein DERP_004110 [Dermatophagoides pteronyssinus]|uniref:Uncharacterized protein n=1 Tax=Dermatophagoides pteronyssinus TaxID=6956 RepID=A0ABQ8J863_DERPT|nr:hypothetical protein DERP_004110 [Dermatophagoides pteronyssinus]